MKTFKEYCLTEHPTIGARISNLKTKLNPVKQLKKKLDQAKDALKKFPGKAKDKAVDKVKAQLDKINVVKKINKKRISSLIDKKKKISDKIDSLKDRV